MTFHRIADVYKQGVQAARIERHEGGTKFSYLPRYLESGGPAVATTLPLTSQAVFTPSGAVPPYFTGLLPEGRRLNSLRRAVKASADDELALLMGAGGDAVGDVQTVPHGEPPTEEAPPSYSIRSCHSTSTRCSAIRGLSIRWRWPVCRTSCRPG